MDLLFKTIAALILIPVITNVVIMPFVIGYVIWRDKNKNK
tara:strand:+ start:5441 stop:5560 length:120 start_codon:yes stop_codon:yes gene_type:complete